MPDPKGQAASDSAKEPIDTRLVRKLADILTATGLTEIEVERGDLKIKVARQTVVTHAPATPAPHAVASVAAAPAASAAAAPAEAPRGEAVKSPMVGTVYLSPQPGADPFVKVGDKVTAGQTLLIVEAMKTMNPIPAPRAGTVLEIIAADSQPVEFGEPLIVLE
jgi:acetyl-CoA carboxylase biotin carboxyl carrier protein